MGWLIYGILAWLTALIIIPLREWKKLWPAGIIAMSILYAIDSTLAGLGAFQFTHSDVKVSGLPVPYWLSYFPGGIVFVYYCPPIRWWKLIYILSAAAILLALELIMLRLGYFHHLNWNPFKSYILNAGGFIATLWLTQWLGITNRRVKNTP
ncbi:hypothetical protein DCCM_2608 [Desulfocucumis palustris]|uniref:Uncharacterized protein n=1 Tax=Desulfocucumis palustris TaxID=1898651 RepID=A0A2L2XH09_9FIRM|nr:hypothetical protein [Desulfocucumis palustris]GBF33506.1 hypothetical protein DCCM_2608 [Desulfocucumis palustris]